MLLNKAADRDWKSTDYPGIERSLFRNNDTGGRSSVVRLLQGLRFPQHAHHGTEEVVVLSGLVSIGGVSLATGDYLFTSPGEEHDVVALADSEIFVSSQNGLRRGRLGGPCVSHSRFVSACGSSNGDVAPF